MTYDFTNKSEREKLHELVKKTIEGHRNNIKLELTVNSLKYIERLIETQERIIEDQEERIAIMSEGEKHGHWIGDSYGYTCSACGKNMAEIADSDDYTFYKTSAYCPFCGAMMDEPPKEGKS